MIIGIGLVAVPTGIFASALVKTKLQKAKLDDIIIFNNSRFLIIGKSKKINPHTNKNYTKNNLENSIKYLDGIIDKQPSNLTDYLVICGTDDETNKISQLNKMKIISDETLIKSILKQNGN